MKKLLLSLLAGIFAVTGFAACTPDEGGSGGRGRATTVNFYTWGNAQDQEMMMEVKAAFEAAYAEQNYKVEFEFATGVYTDNVIQKVGGGNSPDIFHVEPGNFAFFARRGMIENLTPRMSDKLKQELYDINSAYRYDAASGQIGTGDQYALVKDWGPTFALIFNKDLIAQYNARTGKYAGLAGADTITIPEVTLAADGTVSVPAPLKWSEYLDIARRLTRNKGGANAVYGTALDYSYDLHIQEWIQMTGHSLFTDDYGAVDLNDGVRDALEFFTDLQKGETSVCPANSSTAVGGEMFTNGTIATVFYGSWAIPSYRWEEQGLSLGIAPAPMPDSLWKGEVAPTAKMSSSPVGMAVYAGASAKKKDAAYAFLDFFYSEGAKILARRGFNIPATKSVAEEVYTNPAEITNANLVKYNKMFLELGKNHVVVQEYSPRITPTTLKSKFDLIIGNWLSNRYASFDDFLNTLKSSIDGEIV